MFGRLLLMASASRLFAPEDDSGGSDFEGLETLNDEDDQDDIDLDGGDLEDGDDGDSADDDQDDDLDLNEPTERQGRKTFAQRVEEVTNRKLSDIQRKHDAELASIMARVNGGGGGQQSQQGETPQQAQARINTIDDPFERIQAQMNLDRVQNQSVLQRLEFQTAESSDKAAYDSLKVRLPIASKLEADVEKRLTEMRASGVNAPRSTVLRWVIGDRALANAEKAGGRARNRAEGNRQRQTTRPANGRGDVGRGSGRRSGADRSAAEMERDFGDTSI